tara:strand:- start:280 stop:1089 length:810 start_codon:yes stop_codon:yes gene_type:complete
MSLSPQSDSPGHLRFIIPGLGDGPERRALVASNIKFLQRQLKELGVAFSCQINVYGEVPMPLQTVEPCASTFTIANQHETQRNTRFCDADYVAVLFDDANLQTENPVNLSTLIPIIAKGDVDVGVTACRGSGWKVMSPGVGVILSKFYEPFFSVYTAKAWRCRMDLFDIISQVGPSDQMFWDKYEYTFCHSKIGIFKEMVADHTQLGGKHQKFINFDQTVIDSQWRKLYTHMKEERGVLPINYEEKLAVTNKFPSFLEVANGEGYRELK